mmetsp:Transcript_86287/g.268084  ORF Transcript_86287/g.268084 Transcript_86287/m.268084 type:complete len:110 (-) Transcript_86287:554-883(-)
MVIALTHSKSRDDLVRVVTPYLYTAGWKKQPLKFDDPGTTVADWVARFGEVKHQAPGLDPEDIIQPAGAQLFVQESLLLIGEWVEDGVLRLEEGMAETRLSDIFSVVDE